MRSPRRAGIDQAGADAAGWSGWFSGQSGASLAGGLMTEQLANNMVRDHRNSPLLSVMLSWPCSPKKMATYTTSGTTNAATQAARTFQPTRMISRKIRMTTATGAPLPRMTEA